MALSLSPQQALHSPLLVPSKPHQPYSTPRHFTTAVHNDEVLSISSTESPFKSPSSSQVLPPDLPSWTPLKTVEEDESDPEVDQLSVKSRTTDLPMKRFRKSPQATVQNLAVTPTQSTSSLPSGAKPVKRARFDGVLITKKPSSHANHGTLSKPPSTTWGTSLVDALARTFHANSYSADPPTRPLRLKDGVSSKALETEIETSDPEGDLLDLNSRLARRHLKRPFSRIDDALSASVSELNSEEVTPLQHEIPQPDRQIKRLKAIPYEPNAAAIDAALGTVQAPISLELELDFMTRDDDFMISSLQASSPVSLDNPIPADKGNHTATPARKVYLPTGHTREPPTLGGPPKAVFSPYLSRGTLFRQRLDAFFGANATVRTDRNARPRRVEFDFFAFDEPDREPSPALSESSVSEGPASTGEEAATVPSTHITSESPDMPADNVGVEGPRVQLEGDLVTKEALVGEEQISTWVAALQRLVKGKVHVGEEDLESLSVILAEIESLKDGLGDIYLIPELRESIKQLSGLREIPFGDRNRLRQRAENISQTWPSLMEVDSH